MPPPCSWRSCGSTPPTSTTTSSPRPSRSGRSAARSSSSCRSPSASPRSSCPSRSAPPRIAFPRAAAAAAWTYLLGGGLVIGAYAIDGGPFGSDTDGVRLFIVAFLAGAARPRGRVDLHRHHGARPPAPRDVAAPGAAVRLVVARRRHRVAGHPARCSPASCSSPTSTSATAAPTASSAAAAPSPSTAASPGRSASRPSTPSPSPCSASPARSSPCSAGTRHQQHRAAMFLIGAFGVLAVGCLGRARLQRRPLRPGSTRRRGSAVSFADPRCRCSASLGLWALTAEHGPPQLASPLALRLGLACSCCWPGWPPARCRRSSRSRPWSTASGDSLFGTSVTTSVASLRRAGRRDRRLRRRRVLGAQDPRPAGPRERRPPRGARCCWSAPSCGACPTSCPGSSASPASPAPPAPDNTDTIEALNTVSADRRRRARPRLRRPSCCSCSARSARRSCRATIPWSRPHARVGHQLAAAGRQLRQPPRDHLRGAALRRPPSRRGGTRLMATTAGQPARHRAGPRAAPAPRPPHRLGVRLRRLGAGGAHHPRRLPPGARRLPRQRRHRRRARRLRPPAHPRRHGHGHPAHVAGHRVVGGVGAAARRPPPRLPRRRRHAPARHRVRERHRLPVPAARPAARPSPGWAGSSTSSPAPTS